MTKLKQHPGAGKALVEYFPFDSIRITQKLVLEELEKVWKTGKKVIILEAPVGSGKSPIAIAVARWIRANMPSYTETIEQPLPPLPSHLITPRKSLQDQYYEDFAEDIVLMKGRNAYPCTKENSWATYSSICSIIETGETPSPALTGVSCSEGPCRDSKTVYSLCNNERPCPYSVAMKIAQKSETVVHNLHSFLYQTNFGKKFEKRAMLIVDEAHELQGTLRDFSTRKVTLAAAVPESEIRGFKTVKDWETFLLQSKFVPEETAEDKARKAADKEYESARDKYLARVDSLVQREDTYSKGFSVEYIANFKPGTTQQLSTSFEFVPHYVGGEAKRLVFDYGDKILLMSGTIYSKPAFCNSLGLDPETTHFIRIPSSFPKENRPIYLKPAYQTNTSHAFWDENFDEMIAIIKKILGIFHDVKGLIHTPSYYASGQIAAALSSPRIVTHEANNFLSALNTFFARKDNAVLLSPVCQQGVDFKEDRARFQIILRVPYMNTSSKFVEDKIRTDFPWYNYQALVTFGQQIGRVNRSEDDVGATFLLDSRFNQFLQRNNGVLPQWVKDAVIR